MIYREHFRALYLVDVHKFSAAKNGAQMENDFMISRKQLKVLGVRGKIYRLQWDLVYPVLFVNLGEPIEFCLTNVGLVGKRELIYNGYTSS